MNRRNSIDLNTTQTLAQNQRQIQSRMSFLNQFIGKKCSCEFYMDADIIKKTGLLNSVGTDYIILTSINNPEEILVCPFNELKFIKFY